MSYKVLGENIRLSDRRSRRSDFGPETRSASASFIHATWNKRSTRFHQTHNSQDPSSRWSSVTQTLVCRVERATGCSWNHANSKCDILGQMQPQRINYSLTHWHSGESWPKWSRYHDQRWHAVSPINVFLMLQLQLCFHDQRTHKCLFFCLTLGPAAMVERYSRAGSCCINNQQWAEAPQVQRMMQPAETRMQTSGKQPAVSATPAAVWTCATHSAVFGILTNGNTRLKEGRGCNDAEEGTESRSRRFYNRSPDDINAISRQIKHRNVNLKASLQMFLGPESHLVLQ